MGFLMLTYLWSERQKNISLATIQNLYFYFAKANFIMNRALGFIASKQNILRRLSLHCREETIILHFSFSFRQRIRGVTFDPQIIPAMLHNYNSFDLNIMNVWYSKRISFNKRSTKALRNFIICIVGAGFWSLVSFEQVQWKKKGSSRRYYTSYM